MVDINVKLVCPYIHDEVVSYFSKLLDQLSAVWDTRFERHFQRVLINATLEAQSQFGAGSNLNLNISQVMQNFVFAVEMFHNKPVSKAKWYDYLEENITDFKEYKETLLNLFKNSSDSFYVAQPYVQPPYTALWSVAMPVYPRGLIFAPPVLSYCYPYSSFCLPNNPSRPTNLL